MRGLPVRWVGYDAPNRSRGALNQAAKHWAIYGFGRWLLRHDDVEVGTVSLTRCCILGQEEVELGYALVPNAWGCGYATEAGAGECRMVPPTRRYGTGCQQTRIGSASNDDASPWSATRAQCVAGRMPRSRNGRHR